MRGGAGCLKKSSGRWEGVGTKKTAKGKDVLVVARDEVPAADLQCNVAARVK